MNIEINKEILLLKRQLITTIYRISNLYNDLNYTVFKNFRI